jgi:hypothetical protein
MSSRIWKHVILSKNRLSSMLLFERSYTSIDKVQRTTSRLDDFTTYDLTTFTTSRLVIDLETGFTVQK